MGGNNKQKIIRFGNAIIDLILKIYRQGDIMLVKPDIKAKVCEAIVKFDGKFFAIGAAIGNKGMVQFRHNLLIIAGNRYAGDRTQVS